MKQHKVDIIGLILFLLYVVIFSFLAAEHEVGTIVEKIFAFSSAFLWHFLLVALFGAARKTALFYRKELNWLISFAFIIWMGTFIYASFEYSEQNYFQRGISNFLTEGLILVIVCGYTYSKSRIKDNE